jgi:hypothetical protein
MTDPDLAKPKKRKSEKKDKSRKKAKNSHAIDAATATSPPLDASPEPASPVVGAPSSSEQAQPATPVAPAEEAVPMQSPAWFTAAMPLAEQVHATPCRLDALSQDQDIVLVHLPPGMQAADLDGQTIRLPEQSGEACSLEHMEGVEVSRDVGDACRDVFVLSANEGEVAAARVAASFTVQQHLDAVESDEDPVDESLLDTLIEQEKQAAASQAEAAQAEGGTTRRKKSKRDKTSNALEAPAPGAGEEGGTSVAGSSKAEKVRKSDKHKKKRTKSHEMEEEA